MESKPSANGLRTVLDFQQVGETRYFDAAGYPEKPSASSNRPIRPLTLTEKESLNLARQLRTNSPNVQLPLGQGPL